MSAFQESSSADQIDALRGLSLAAFTLGIESWSILARRGLVRPEEAEAAFAPVLEMYDRLPLAMHDAMPYDFTAGLAEIKRLSAVNWKGE